MSVIQKCTSWRGHRFQPRYSLGVPTITPLDCWNGRLWLESNALAAMEISRTKTYECDVCVRCGQIARNATQVPATEDQSS